MTAGSWGDWQTYAATLPWQLSPGDGTKTVGLEVQDVAGTVSPEVTATIELDTTPPEGPSFTINGGAASTDSTDVTIDLTAADAVQVRFCNEGGSWCDWRSITAGIPWTLSAGDGPKQVSCQTRDAAQNESPVASQTIILQSAPVTGLSITINGGAPVTNQSEVTLSLTTGDATEMRLQERDGRLVRLDAVRRLLAWDLTAGDGAKTSRWKPATRLAIVSADVSAEITLDTTPPCGLNITINGGATATNDAAVTLSLVTGDSTAIRLKNETGDWSDWMTPASTLTWNLTPGDGYKQVFVQGQDLAGNVSSEFSAAIRVDTVPPSGVGLTIDNGAVQTILRQVTLAIAATGADEMRFRNEGGDWSDWEPLAASKDWTLSSGSAQKTVSVQCRDFAGNLSDEVSAGILWTAFSDTPPDYWAYAQIMACVDAGIVRGFEDGLYHPDADRDARPTGRLVARALSGGVSQVPPYTGNPTFSDISSDNWAYNEIEYCYSSSIVYGYPDGYHPRDPVNRDQMSVFMSRGPWPAEIKH